MKLRAVLLSTVLSMIFAASASAATTTISVQAGTPDDSGSAANCTAVDASGNYSCPTPRDAVALANSVGGDPTIQLSAGTFSLTHGALEPTVEMDISGAGDQGSSVTTITPSGIAATAGLLVTGLVLDGNGTGCQQVVEDSAAAISVQGVTITGASCAPAAGLNEGEGGLPAVGAAIDAPSSVLSLVDSTVSGNVDAAGAAGPAGGSFAAGAGGEAGAAIDVQGLEMAASVVTDNTSTGGAGGAGSTSHAAGSGGSVTGAGIELSNTTNSPLALSIFSSFIADNTATGGAGGTNSGATQGGSGGPVLGSGLWVDAKSSASDPAVISNTTVSGNTAQAGQAASNTASGGAGGGANYAGGAGLYATGTFPLQISETTFSANQSIVPDAGRGPGTEIGSTSAATGAGMYLENGPAVTVVNSTIAGNTAQSGAGTIGTVGTVGSFGGGIEAYGVPALALDSDTVSGNSVASANGAQAEIGANLLAVGSPITLTDTAIANALPAGAPNCEAQNGGTFIDGGYNLEDTSPSTCGLNGATHDQLGPSGLPGTPTANGSPAIAEAGAITPAIPALATLAPAAGSLLIGNGGACVNPLMAGSPPLTKDERGDARPGICDIGAFQTQPLAVSGAPAITGTPAVGQTLTCGSGSFVTSGDGAPDASGALGGPSIAYTWTSGQTTLATTQTYTVAVSDQGNLITCTETATGAYGHGSATSASVSVPAAVSSTSTTTTTTTTTGTSTTGTTTTGTTTTGTGATSTRTGTTTTGAGATTPGTGATTPGTSTATAPLKLTGLRQTHATWSEAKHKHGPARDTAFTYTLNAAATVSFTFARVSIGRTVGGKCLAETRQNAGKRRCSRLTRVGSLAHASPAGQTTLAFTGKVGRRLLAPGTYTVTITARAGGASTAAQKLTFTIKA